MFTIIDTKSIFFSILITRQFMCFIILMLFQAVNIQKIFCAVDP